MANPIGPAGPGAGAPLNPPAGNAQQQQQANQFLQLMQLAAALQAAARQAQVPPLVGAAQGGAAANPPLAAGPAPAAGAANPPPAQAAVAPVVQNPQPAVANPQGSVRTADQERLVHQMLVSQPSDSDWWDSTKVCLSYLTCCLSLGCCDSEKSCCPRKPAYREINLGLNRRHGEIIQRRDDKRELYRQAEELRNQIQNLIYDTQEQIDACDSEVQKIEALRTLPGSRQIQDPYIKGEILSDVYDKMLNDAGIPVGQPYVPQVLMRAPAVQNPAFARPYGAAPVLQPQNVAAAPAQQSSASASCSNQGFKAGQSYVFQNNGTFAEINSSSPTSSASASTSAQKPKKRVRITAPTDTVTDAQPRVSPVMPNPKLTEIPKINAFLTSLIFEPRRSYDPSAPLVTRWDAKERFEQFLAQYSDQDQMTILTSLTPTLRIAYNNAMSSDSYDATTGHHKWA